MSNVATESLRWADPLRQRRNKLQGGLAVCPRGRGYGSAEPQQLGGPPPQEICLHRARHRDTEETE